MKVSALPADQQLNLTDRVLIDDEGGTKTATIQQLIAAITAGSGGDVNLSLGAEPKEISYSITVVCSSGISTYVKGLINVRGYVFGNLFYYLNNAQALTTGASESEYKERQTIKLSDLNPSWTRAYILRACVKNGISEYSNRELSGGDQGIPTGDRYRPSNSNWYSVASAAAIGIAF